MEAYKVITVTNIPDIFAGTNVPGEFRSLTSALGSKQLAVTFIHIPPHSDFEQGTGHYHKEIEEVYIITKGTLTMRFGNDVQKVSAGSVARVAPKTPRSHRNESDEPVDMWAVSCKLGNEDAIKIDNFWPPSAGAAQSRS